jgi:hypothetical protein
MSFLLGSWSLLVGLAINGAIAGVAFYGFQQGRARRGWAMLAAAFTLRAVSALPHAYATWRLTAGATTSEYSRLLMQLGWVDFALTPLSALLIIGGLLALVEESRRDRNL